MCCVCVVLFYCYRFYLFCFFFQAEDGIRDGTVTGVQTCALPISLSRLSSTGCVDCSFHPPMSRLMCLYSTSFTQSMLATRQLLEGSGTSRGLRMKTSMLS